METSCGVTGPTRPSSGRAPCAESNLLAGKRRTGRATVTQVAQTCSGDARGFAVAEARKDDGRDMSPQWPATAFPPHGDPTPHSRTQMPSGSESCQVKSRADEIPLPARDYNPQWVGSCIQVHNAGQSVIAAQVRISSRDQALDKQMARDVIGMKTPPTVQSARSVHRISSRLGRKRARPFRRTRPRRHEPRRRTLADRDAPPRPSRPTSRGRQTSGVERD